MTPEAQRIAIAEACGWKHVADNPFERDGIAISENIPLGAWYHPALSGCSLSPPDYLCDLNAMHEAEKYAGEHLMDGDQWEEYGRQLERMHPQACVKATDGSIDYYDLATLLTDLTAAQRAEAFLRTLGLWKE